MPSAQDVAVYAEVSRLAHESERAALETRDRAADAVFEAVRVRVLADEALSRARALCDQPMAQSA